MKEHIKGGPKVWESQTKTGSFYMSNAPPIEPTNVKKIELAAVLQEKHNRTHAPSQHIHVYGGSPTENAYAKASWVERDEEAKRAEIDNASDDEVDAARNSPSKPNGWKLATRTEFGYIDKNSTWAKVKTERPFLVPPTEEDVYLSDDDDDDDDMVIPLSPAPTPVNK